MIRRNAPILIVLLALIMLQVILYQPSEPFFNNDETRHVMSGVFFMDLLHDRPAHLRQYAIDYYLQYPALGILVWPPLFYGLEGVAMSVFGTSVVVARILLGLFAVLACVYLFLLSRRVVGPNRAAMAVLAFGTTPQILKYSHFVMLEVPMLALALGATYHFVVYLEQETRRDLCLWGLLCAAAALTRFDVIYLLVLFPVLLTVQRKWGILRRREVLLTIIGTLCLIAPVYLLTASNVGWLHAREVAQTMDPGEPPMLSWKRLFFYPATLPHSLSWFSVGAAALGIAAAIWRRDRPCLVFAAIIGAVYVTFTPIAEMKDRHVIYWVPALAFFAAEGVYYASQRWRRGIATGVIAGLVFGGALAQAPAQVRTFLAGYADAARYVETNTASPPLCLFVGSLDGNFIYQLRRADPARRMWTLRGEKLVDTLAQSRKSAAQPGQMLAAIYQYSPTFILVQKVNDPTLIADSEWLARLVQEHPERFRLEREFPITTNDPQYAGGKILAYRNLVPNPAAPHTVELHIRMLRQSVQARLP
jgi:hypothetical protein